MSKIIRGNEFKKLKLAFLCELSLEVPMQQLIININYYFILIINC